MSTQSNKQLVLDWVEALSAGNAAKVVSFYAEDLEYFCLGNWPLGGTFGRDHMERFSGEVFTVFPEGLEFTPHQIAADGDWVALEMESRGMHASGRLYSNRYTYWFQFRDGKMIKLREFLDTKLAEEVLCSPQTNPDSLDFADRREH